MLGRGMLTSYQIIEALEFITKKTGLPFATYV